MVWLGVAAGGDHAGADRTVALAAQHSTRRFVAGDVICAESGVVHDCESDARTIGRGILGRGDVAGWWLGIDRAATDALATTLRCTDVSRPFTAEIQRTQRRRDEMYSWFIMGYSQSVFIVAFFLAVTSSVQQ